MYLPMTTQKVQVTEARIKMQGRISMNPWDPEKHLI
jgi:hypothetical protein